MKKVIAVTFLLACIGFMPVVTFAGESGGRAIVMFADGTSKIISFSSDIEYAGLIRLYAASPDVAFIEREVFYTTAVIPDDPLFGSQSTLSAINAEEAWDVTKGTSDVIVAVLDSGIDTAHPDLASNIWNNSNEIAGNGKDDDGNGFIDDRIGWDFVDSDKDPKPELSGSVAAGHHGTVIAGIVGAKGDNEIGVAGLSWNTKIMALRVLDQNGNGNSINATLAVEYAIAHGADIINLSFVGSNNSASLQQAIATARNKGVLVVAAAGNENKNLNIYPRYPVCNLGVLGVASVTTAGVKSSFTNYGSKCIDVSAPGQGIVSTVSTDPASTLPDDYSSGWQGTSFAAPHIAGVAALALSATPSLTLEQLENVLVNTAVTDLDSSNPSYAGMLGGLINAEKAVAITALPSTDAYRILTIPFSNGGPQLRGFLASGDVYKSDFVESSDYRGGGSIASGDVNGDGKEEIIYGTGRGTSSRIRIFNHQNTLLKEFLAFSSPQNGVIVTSGDTNGDGTDEIIAVRENGATADIRIFNYNGTIQDRFFSYPNTFLGGMTLASADVNNDGKDEIIVGTGTTGLPRVQIFDRKGVKLEEFFAYGLGYRGGVNVAAGDVDGDGKVEIITAPIRYGGPHVRIFSVNGTPEKDFFAYGSGFHGGVSVSVGDVDGDGIDDIITGAGQGGGPHVRMFHGSSTKSIGGFFAYGENFHGGIRVLGYKE